MTSLCRHIPASILLSSISLWVYTSMLYAHPGGLNSAGCHTNKKTGEYHCHRGEHAKSKTKRSSSVRRAFLKSQGLTHTPPGCQVDHIIALSCGGKDDLSNLQLLCGEALREKESREQECPSTGAHD